MQQRQDRVLITITLVGLGLMAGIFGLVSLFVKGRPTPTVTSAVEPTESSSAADDSDNDSADSADLVAVQNVPQGLFNYGGSTTWIPIHEVVNAAIADAFPEFQLRYTLPSSGAPGSGTGIGMLLEGQLSFSESSRSLKPEEYAAAEQRGYSLEQIPVALDGIALAVNPELPVDGLTIDQVQAIYSGVVTNWSDVGGPDLPITPYSRSPEAAGTANYFLDSVIGAEAYGGNVVFVENTTTGVREVLANPGGIYFASAPEIVNQCSIYAIPLATTAKPDSFVSPYADTWRTGQDCLNQSNTVNKAAFRAGNYPLTRRLFVVVKADGSDDETAGRAYVNMLLSSQGQTLVEESGFVGIR